MRQTDDSHLDHLGKQGHADEHKAGFAEYLRLALMALVIVASLTGWWRHWMSRDWLAFAATLIGGFPIYEEAWENLRKRLLEERKHENSVMSIYGLRPGEYNMIKEYQGGVCAICRRAKGTRRHLN